LTTSRNAENDDPTPISIAKALDGIRSILSIPAVSTAIVDVADHRTSAKMRGIPAEFLGAHRSLIQTQLPNAPSNVFLFGGNGVGKSFAAAVLAHEWLGSWCDMTRLPMQIRASRSFTSEESEERIFEKLGGPFVLVLDDLWAISAIPGGLEWILAALNVRRRPGYSTIVTSHSNLAEIDKVSGHVASRLGAFKAIWIEGKDRRIAT
jgi:DNA replication protein DnaC